MSAPEPMLGGRDPGALDGAARRELLSAYLDDELPADEARIVTRWLEDNPEVLRDIEHARRVWDLLDHYADEPVAEGFAARVLAAAGVRREGRLLRLDRVRTPWMLAAAAAVLVAVGAGLALRPESEPPPAPQDRGAAAILDTVPDELVEHMDLLADFGSDDFEAALIDARDFEGEELGG